VNYPTLGPSLVRHQPFAEQTLGGLAHLVLTGAELDAAGLAAGSRMDLRLYRPAVSADLGGTVDRLFRTVGHAAARDGNAEAGKELLGLVLVDVHSRFASQESGVGIFDRESM
jgi:hypothetical protein